MFLKFFLSYFVRKFFWNNIFYASLFYFFYFLLFLLLGHSLWDSGTSCLELMNHVVAMADPPHENT